MAPKYIAFFVFLFVIGTFLGLVVEEATFGAGEQDTVNALTYWESIPSEESWGTWEMITFVPGYMGTLWKAAVWDFAFLTGPASYIKWFIWAPLMSMFVWGVILTFLSLFWKILG